MHIGRFSLMRGNSSGELNTSVQLSDLSKRASEKNLKMQALFEPLMAFVKDKPQLMETPKHRELFLAIKNGENLKSTDLHDKDALIFMGNLIDFYCKLTINNLIEAWKQNDTKTSFASYASFYNDIHEKMKENPLYQNFNDAHKHLCTQYDLQSKEAPLPNPLSEFHPVIIEKPSCAKKSLESRFACIPEKAG